MAVNYQKEYWDATAKQNSIAAQKAAALLKKTRYTTNQAPATGKVQDP